MSCLLMRPPAPVPGTEARSMPYSLAMRRTSGELWMRSPAGRDGADPGPEAAAGAGAEGFAACGGGGTVAGFAAGAGAAGLAGSAAFGAGAGAGAAALAAPSPAASITPTTVWIGTVLPSPTLISFSTPAEGEGISASTLSVEISNSGSSRSTLSPGFLSHLVMVPSKMLSPIWGITMSTAMIALLFSQNPKIARVLSRRKKSFSHSAENALPASAHTVPAYPARPRARAARRDHGKPFRKVSHRSRRQFHRSWYLHARLDTCWSFSLNLKSSLHPGAVEYANRSLRLRFLPSQELRPLRERYASWRRRKGWSDASLRGAQRLCRWVRCNHRRELLL